MSTPNPQIVAAMREAMPGRAAMSEQWATGPEVDACALVAERMAVEAHEAGRVEERERHAALREALEFYADPASYFAVGVFGDSPCGEFYGDVSDCGGEWGFRHGAKARAALAALELTEEGGPS